MSPLLTPRSAILLLVLSLLSAPGSQAQQKSSAKPTAGATSTLHALFDEEWQFEMREEPLFATYVGDHRYDDRLPSVSRADEERRAKARKQFLDRFEAIPRSSLGAEDRVSLDMMERQLRDDITDVDFGAYQIPITADEGFHIDFARLPTRVPLATPADYEHYIARLRAWPTYVNQHIANMRAGLARGFTMPRVSLTGYEGTISAHVVTDPTTSVFYKPFVSFPNTVPEKDRARLREAGLAAVRDAVIPGYKAFLDFMTTEYIPHARETIGASALPDGQRYYAYRVRHYTTLDIGPDSIHKIGLSEVARIQGEMDAAIKQTGFAGDFPAFLQMLRTDPRFYPKTPEELLERASWIAKRMDGKLPSLFKTLPRLPYGIEPVPDELAPKYTAGRYIPAPVGSTRAGMYWVNVYALSSRPFYALESLTLHEAVPGHHLQFALAQELTGLPAFRRFVGVDAYSEGWGLYSERLGLEAGFYTDPYSNFGRLTYEMWRACRLVVDTGIHSMGWTRQQALDYMAQHTALSLHEVETETDRYIAWPGQALAYKMGELEIRALRRQAEEALGTRFDVREFHDVVLRHGVVTLSVLRDQVASYIHAASREPARAGR